MVADGGSAIAVCGMAAKDLVVLGQASLQPYSDLDTYRIVLEVAQFRNSGVDARQMFGSGSRADDVANQGGNLFYQTTASGVDNPTIGRDFFQFQ